MTAVDELRALDAAATEGPWECGRFCREADGDRNLVFGEETEIYPPPGERGPVAVVRGPAENAALIAAMRNALPGLLAVAEAAKAERDAFVAFMAAREINDTADEWPRYRAAREATHTALARLDGAK
jgi:hypothetical protein